MITEEHVLRHVARQSGLAVEWTEAFGYRARFPGSRAFFTLGRTPGRALARLTVALQAAPAAGVVSC